MDRLKAETASLHDEAEDHLFQRRLVRGELSRKGYVAYLEGMCQVHQTLEASLRDAATRDSIVSAFPAEPRFREDALRRDLAHFGAVAGDLSRSPAVESLCDTLRKTCQFDPTGLLGHLYVLEGSTNGSRFIARAVRRAYGLTGCDGTAYLDPHGEQQQAQWALFKEQMRRLDLSVDQKAGIVNAARDMFIAIMRISDELMDLEAPCEMRYSSGKYGGQERSDHVTKAVHRDGFEAASL